MLCAPTELPNLITVSGDLGVAMRAVRIYGNMFENTRGDRLDTGCVGMYLKKVFVKHIRIL